MRPTAGVSGAGAASSAAGASLSPTSPLSPVGVGAGGAVVAAALVCLLAYYDIVDVAERDDDDTVALALDDEPIETRTAIVDDGETWEDGFVVAFDEPGEKRVRMPCSATTRSVCWTIRIANSGWSFEVGVDRSIQ